MVKGKLLRKILLMAAAMVLAVTLISCDTLLGILNVLGVGELSDIFDMAYVPTFVAAESLWRGSAGFYDLSPDDRWAILWGGMFRKFIESDQYDDGRDITRLALHAIGIDAECYDEAFVDPSFWTDNKGNVHRIDGYTIRKYRVENRDDLVLLFSEAISLIESETDPEKAAMWMEDLYGAVMDTEGKHNGYALIPLLPYLEKAAEHVFELDTDPSLLSDDSFSALAALYYIETYPAGYLREYAEKRQKLTVGADLDFVF